MDIENKNNSENLFLSIKSVYPSMTEGEKKVADFVLETNPKDTITLSISDLAAQCEVSTTSITRFCKSLKLKGYQEFRLHLAMQSNNIKEKADDEYLPEQVKIDDDIRTASKKLYQGQLRALEDTYKMLDYEKIHKAVELINNSDQIRFFGVGVSSLSAMIGMFKFLHIMPNVYCLSDLHMQIMGASTLNSNDVAIFITKSGESEETVRMAKIAKEAGASTIVLTSYEKSHVANYADVVLLCGGYEPPIQDGSFSSQSAMMYLLDVLFTETYKVRFDYSKNINDTVISTITQNIAK